ncbi:peptide chain release factor N(5)-glutamine methyltransferase [Sphingomonas sp.]
MADIRAALADAARRLAGVSDTARLDAELLMAHALGTTREELLLRRLGDDVPDGFATLVERRLAHEPVAYIVGERAFWTIRLMVGPGVLVPRADSETLIEAAVAHFADRPGPARVLDLGCGPGTLLLAALAEWPDASGLGIDSSTTALLYARANVDRLGLRDRVTLREGDWGEGLDERFDLILANPPYVGIRDTLGADVSEWEPGEALYAGTDGLDAYRAILPQIPHLMAEGGVAVLEIGSRQAEAVAAMAASAGLSPVLRHDLAGRPRAIVAT